MGIVIEVENDWRGRAASSGNAALIATFSGLLIFVSRFHAVVHYVSTCDLHIDALSHGSRSFNFISRELSPTRLIYGRPFCTYSRRLRRVIILYNAL